MASLIVPAPFTENIVRVPGGVLSPCVDAGLMGMLRDMGFGFTQDPFEAGIIVINTCAIRENAEKKVFGVVGQLVQTDTQAFTPLSRTTGSPSAMAPCSSTMEKVRLWSVYTP